MYWMEGIRKRKKNRKNKRSGFRVRRLLELVGLMTFLTGFRMSFPADSCSAYVLRELWQCEPQLILFDEAISSLDAHTQVQVMDLYRT